MTVSNVILSGVNTKTIVTYLTAKIYITALAKSIKHPINFARLQNEEQDTKLIV